MIFDVSAVSDVDCICVCVCVCYSLPPKLSIMPDTGRWIVKRSPHHLSSHDPRWHLYEHTYKYTIRLTVKYYDITYLFISQMTTFYFIFWTHFTPTTPLCFQAPVSAGGASKEPADDQKEDGVFKAPPPPPKVTKCVTVPTDLYRDSVTALKCRKEHKEVYRGSHAV